MFKGKKLIATFGMVSIVAASMAIGAYAADDIKLIVNGKQAASKVEIIDGSSYVPLRAVAEMLGAEVKWDEGKREIVITGKAENATQGSEYTAGPLLFHDVQVKKGALGWEVSTEIKNNGDKAIKMGTATAVFYDAEGKRLGTASLIISDLGLGETKTKEGYASEDLTGWKTIKFQVDSVLN